jgi:hypothetical protein
MAVAHAKIIDENDPQVDNLHKHMCKLQTRFLKSLSLREAQKSIVPKMDSLSFYLLITQSGDDVWDVKVQCIPSKGERQ